MTCPRSPGQQAVELRPSLPTFKIHMPFQRVRSILTSAKHTAQLLADWLINNHQ